MSKAYRCISSKYIDSSSVTHNHDTLKNYLSYISACGLFGLNTTITLSKDFTWSGVQIPLDYIYYNYGGAFSLNNGKIYSNVSAIIHVSVFVPSSLGDGYLLFGDRNGAYRAFTGATNNTSLAGYVYMGSIEQQIWKGEYVTLLIGRTSTFSGEYVYGDCKVSVSVVRFL